MIYLYIRQTVSNSGRWKEAFDIHFAARQAGGAMREMLVLCNVDDLYEIVLILGWRNLAQAQLFIQSVSWQMAQQQMGVVEVLSVQFLAEVG